MDTFLSILSYAATWSVGIVLGFVIAAMLMANKLKPDNEDTERLDWLERTHSILGRSKDSWGVLTSGESPTVIGNIAESVRSAIDSARLKTAVMAPPKKP